MSNELGDRSSPLEKVFALIRTLAEAERPLGLGELSLALDLPKTTVHRMAGQLERMGLVQREPGSRHLTLAGGMFRLAGAVLRASVRHGERLDVLRTLSRETGTSCAVTVRFGYEMLVLESVTAEGTLAVRFPVGGRLPMHCTASGKLHLARMGEAEWTRFLAAVPLERRTVATLSEPPRLRAALDAINASGLALSLEEYEPGVIAAAVAVPGYDGRLLAALVAAAPTVHCPAGAWEAWRPALDRAAGALGATYVDAADGEARQVGLEALRPAR